MAGELCGGKQTLPQAPTLFSTIGLIGGVIGTVVGVGEVIGKVAGATATIAAAGTAVAGFLNSASWFTTWFMTGITGAGVLAVAAIILVALSTAIVIWIWASTSYNALCGAPLPGRLACVSGVIDFVQGGFTYDYSELVGFAGNQPRIDVVVKSAYWPTLTADSASYVWCSSCANCPPSVAGPAAVAAGGNPPCSPVLPCYYHNPQVCAAAKGSEIGASIGAALGAVFAAIGGILAVWAAGCLSAAVFAWVCYLILAVVILAVIIGVVLAALIGSAVGTQAGKASAGGSSAPTTTTGTALTAGTYVSVLGNMVQAKQSLGSNALWFAGWVPNANGTTVDDLTTTNGNGTTVLGMSSLSAPFCYTDPEAGIPDNMDICFPPSL